MRIVTDSPDRRLRRALLLTWAALAWERLARAFWPLASLLAAVAGLLMLGVHDLVPVIALWWAGGAVAVLAAALAVRGAWLFDWPGRDAARARLDATMPGRPLQALSDTQATGARDGATVALWRAHRARMARLAARARPVGPDARLKARDPHALRYAAALVVLVALVFGSAGRIGSVRDLAPGGGAAAASGPSWEGWIEPPAYTGLPTLYLPDLPEGPVQVAQGATVTVRVYGDADRYAVTATVSDAGAARPMPPRIPDATTPDARPTPMAPTACAWRGRGGWPSRGRAGARGTCGCAPTRPRAWRSRARRRHPPMAT